MSVDHMIPRDILRSCHSRITHEHPDQTICTTYADHTTTGYTVTLHAYAMDVIAGIDDDTYTYGYAHIYSTLLRSTDLLLYDCSTGRIDITTTTAILFLRQKSILLLPTYHNSSADSIIPLLLHFSYVHMSVHGEYHYYCYYHYLYRLETRIDAFHN